jgi:SAM-dependent methyltransferase
MSEFPPANTHTLNRAIGFFRDGTTLVDIGCRHGAYALAFAANGFVVTGIDARVSNLAQCQEVARCEYIHADAKVIMELGRQWDHAFCSGLLYHLDDPARFLIDLFSVTKFSAVIDTHFSDEKNQSRFAERLGSLTNHKGFPGRWFREYQEGATLDQIETYSQSAWSNSTSFWPTRDGLVDMAVGAGFRIMREDRDDVNQRISLCLRKQF